MRPFAGGIRDDEGRRAFLPLPGGEIAAVDLGDGALLWRRSGLGRPIAATASRLITLSGVGGRCHIHGFDAATGEAVFTAPAPRMPDWAAEFVDDVTAVQIRATPAGEEIRLAWTARAPRPSGPAPRLDAAPPARASGAVVVELASGRTQPTAEPPPSDVEPPQGEEMGAADTAGPDLIGRAHVGGLAYELRLTDRSPDDRRLVLRASDAATGSAIWSAELGEITPQRPPPPRP